MPKAVAITPETFTSSATVPAAATAPRGRVGRPRTNNDTALQLRVPREMFTEFKIQAARVDLSMSELFQKLFREYMEKRKGQ